MTDRKDVPREAWDALAHAKAHPFDPSAKGGVEELQTHISRLFLTADRVYKFRKPVNLGFLDFSSLAERDADCLREVQLNRRLAPDVYLGVAPLTRSDKGWAIGTVSETLDTEGDTEHCVVMRRLPEGADGLSRLEAGRLDAADLETAALKLAQFHEANRISLEALPDGVDWLEAIGRPFEDCLEALERSACPGVEASRISRVRAAAHAWMATAADRFETRRAAGRAVDGHGDLHLAHLWFEREGEPPLVVDCVEFSAPLRRIDAASDVAFLAMDLTYRGHGSLAERFLRAYAREADDFTLYGVVDYFCAYRAAVRAKVAALAATDAAIPAAQRERAARSATDHLALAERFLRRRGPGAAIAMCGVVGSGKSSVAERIADAVRGVVIASDRVRKSSEELGARRRSGLPTYAPERIAAVYEAMLERAAPVVESGRVAILDATHSETARRGISVILVETRCPRDETLARLALRQAAGRDPSDAGPAVYALSVARFEPPDEWPDDAHFVVEAGADPSAGVREIASRLQGDGSLPRARTRPSPGSCSAIS